MSTWPQLYFDVKAAIRDPERVERYIQNGPDGMFVTTRDPSADQFPIPAGDDMARWHLHGLTTKYLYAERKQLT